MALETFLNGKVTLCCGDSRQFLVDQSDNRYDSIVTDPPYALISSVKRFANSPRSEATEDTKKPHGRTGRGFMGKTWDNGDVAHDALFWSECLRVLKPGGYVLAFGGTRTYHRLAVAIEDAGFEIRDMVQWLYGSGFPKSHDVSNGIDRAAGAEREVISEGAAVKRMIPGADQNKDGWINDDGRAYVPSVTAPATDAAKQWAGWGTALKPACEPICMARKPLSEGTVAANVLKWGTGAINIDGCRIEAEGGSPAADRRALARKSGNAPMADRLFESGKASDTEAAGKIGRRGSADVYMQERESEALGRWPANVITDGSEEVLAAFPDSDHARGNIGEAKGGGGMYGHGLTTNDFGAGDVGSAARFFYAAKADGDDRLGSKHPTVKPVDLMQWLVRLVTPKYVPYCFECEERTNYAPLQDQPAQADSRETVRGMRDSVLPARPKEKTETRDFAANGAVRNSRRETGLRRGGL